MWKITSHLQRVCLELQVCGNTYSLKHSLIVRAFLLSGDYWFCSLLNNQTKNYNFFLKEIQHESFIENFNLAFTQYMAAIQCIIPVFIYMVIYSFIYSYKHSWTRVTYFVSWCIWLNSLNCIILFASKNKFYIETKLNKDLKDDLMDLFSDHVAKKHINTLIRKYILYIFC